MQTPSHLLTVRKTGEILSSSSQLREGKCETRAPGSSSPAPRLPLPKAKAVGVHALLAGSVFETVRSQSGISTAEQARNSSFPPSARRSIPAHLRQLPTPKQPQTPLNIPFTGELVRTNCHDKSPSSPHLPPQDLPLPGQRGGSFPWPAGHPALPWWGRESWSLPAASFSHSPHSCCSAQHFTVYKAPFAYSPLL